MFDSSRLWLRTLGDSQDSATERLRTSFRLFRERATHLAGEIHRYLPTFTVHDVSHLDALWEIADIIIGETYPLNPAEAYVLGGSFLLHDTAMSLAAYPGGLDSLKQDPNWGDLIVGILQPRLDRMPSPEEIKDPPKEVVEAAVSELLRLRHAEQAERLATTKWSSQSGESFTLIEDDGIRSTYGRLIGKIAHSHWWPVDKLRTEFQIPLGAPPWARREWTVDPLKISCILRCADAAHLDARRAPRFLAVLRRLAGVAANHWAFQGHLSRPHTDDDRLVFTCATPFPPEEADAWWLCLDTIRMVDEELRHGDALLADTGRPRFLARSVAGSDDPARLRHFIPTEGWDPVETRVRITDVPALVERLGGRELYGNDPSVPLRELLQNAIDAVRARRIIEDRSDTWGQVVVRIGRDEFGSWLEVEDSGIGMSRAVLTGPLLDFGTSYWRSTLAREENPGLIARGFEPAGRFGIGFFSTFMWGDRVRVTSRRAEDARTDTRVLEFGTGVRARPILRTARKNELLTDGGTRVRVWLREEPHAFGGLLYSSPGESPLDLEQLVASLCPATAVDLFVDVGEGSTKRVVAAHDWLQLDEAKLAARAHTRIPKKYAADFDEHLRTTCKHMRLIPSKSGGTPIGRACLGQEFPYFESRFRSILPARAAVVGPGGVVTGYVQHVSGVLRGEPHEASRSYAVPSAQGETLSKWVTEQASLQKPVLPVEKLIGLAKIAYALGGQVDALPIATGRSGLLTIADVAEMASRTDELLLVNSSSIFLEENDRGDEAILNENVIVVEGGRPGFVWPQYEFERHSHRYVEWPPESVLSESEGWVRNMQFHSRTLQGLVVKTIAQAWHVDLALVYSSSEFSDDNNEVRRVIGSFGDEIYEDDCDVVRRPPVKVN